MVSLNRGVSLTGLASPPQIKNKMNGEKQNYKYTVRVVSRSGGIKTDEVEVVTFATNENQAKSIAEIVKEELASFKGSNCDYCITKVDTTINLCPEQ
jgi:hypothetical protein